jgi:DNA (cytosine-5)-methyltransferase 1
MVKVMDLFAGCGGLSLGFEKNGYKIDTAIEFDQMIADSYSNNHLETNVIAGDIRDVNPEEFSNRNIKVIIGGPPCQGFSMAGARIRKKAFIEDERNYLFKHYFKMVQKIKPDVFVMENVKGIQSMENGKIFEEILRIFSDQTLLGGDSYNVTYRVARAVEFGIPQKRERMIIIGVKNSSIDVEKIWNEAKNQITYRYPSYFSVVTVRDAISNLPAPTENGIIDTPLPITEYQEFLSDKDSPTLKNHLKTKHSSKAIERMEKIHGGENYTVLDEQINSVHSGSYGRLRWNDQTPTITTRFDTPAGGRFIHPTENRTLTPREAARIQSFPDSFVFTGTKTSICKQIGNAVPPKIAYFLSEVVKLILERK